MQIHGPSHVHGTNSVNGPHHPQLRGPSHGATAAPAARDQLDISPAAQAAIRAQETGEVRLDVVARIRSEIAAGTYETADKLDGAVERLLDEIG